MFTIIIPANRCRKKREDEKAFLMRLFILRNDLMIKNPWSLRWFIDLRIISRPNRIPQDRKCAVWCYVRFLFYLLLLQVVPGLSIYLSSKMLSRKLCAARS